LRDPSYAVTRYVEKHFRLKEACLILSLFGHLLEYLNYEIADLNMDL